MVPTLSFLGASPKFQLPLSREAVHLLAKCTHGTGGLILLDCDGNPGFALNTPRMVYGYVAIDGNFVAIV